MKLPKASVKKPASIGHYRPPTVRIPGMGGYNAPTRGRAGKQMPQPRKPGSPKKR